MDDWLKKGEYLPPEFRDFHDQKELFKIVDRVVQRGKKRMTHPHVELPNWVSAHIYVIDFFLWSMARLGWTLQRSRKKKDFDDYQKIKSEFRAMQIQELKDVFDNEDYRNTKDE